MRKIFTCLLALVLLLGAVTACRPVGTVGETGSDRKDESSAGNSSGDSPEPDELSLPAFWRVTDGEGGVLWLLGSIHVGDEDTNQYPDYIMDAYESSQVVAVECDISNETALSVKYADQIQRLALGENPIYEVFSDKIYQAGVEFFEENGGYYEMYDLFAPFMWTNMMDLLYLEQCSYLSEYGVDQYFLGLAYDDNKEICEVEGYIKQLNKMAGLSDRYYEMYALSLICTDYKEYAASLRELYEMWRSGEEIISETDERELEALSEEIEEFGFTVSEVKALEKEYVQAMMTERNAVMADAAAELLEEGNETFYIVGAAHMWGEDGIVSLLDSRGYTVERVEASVRSTQGK